MSFESTINNLTTETNTVPQIDIRFRINDFVIKHQPKLYILTPCFGGVCFVNFMVCLIKTRDIFREFNFPIEIKFCKNDSLVSRARNNLVAQAMSDPAMTHMLFIDNDITWDPLDIFKLIMSEKELVGGIYPLKHYYWEKLSQTSNTDQPNVIKSWIDNKNNSILKDVVSDTAIIQHKLLNYNVNYLENVLKIENNLARVKHLATGFMMIKRMTIDKMILAFPSTKYTDDIGFLEPHENKYAYALFDCGVEEGHYFSEDWLFCHRWKKMGGDIFIDISINLMHTGIEDYSGSYISSLV